MRRRFVTLDVFTNKRFAGNPLAVVLDPDGLDTAAMQTIAREFNLSETVFVFPPADKANRAKLRIFTPARELPFAGHPTVGTAVLLGRIDGGDRAFTLEEQVGLVPCRVKSSGPDSGSASFDIPRLPSQTEGSADAGAPSPRRSGCRLPTSGSTASFRSAGRRETRSRWCRSLPSRRSGAAVRT